MRYALVKGTEVVNVIEGEPEDVELILVPQYDHVVLLDSDSKIEIKDSYIKGVFVQRSDEDKDADRLLATSDPLREKIQWIVKDELKKANTVIPEKESEITEVLPPISEP